MISEEEFIKKNDERIKMIKALSTIESGMLSASQMNLFQYIQVLTRCNMAKDILNVGAQITVNCTNQTFIFDVVAFNKYKPTQKNLQYSTTLMLHDAMTLRNTNVSNMNDLCFDAVMPSNPDSKYYSGSAQYGVSDIRQWLNSSATSGNWWSSKKDYDDYTSNFWYNKTGFLGSDFLNNADFLAVLGECEINVYDHTYGGTNEVVTYNDKVFLPSLSNLNLVDKINYSMITPEEKEIYMQEGDVFDYYVNSTNAMRKKAEKDLTSNAKTSNDYIDYMVRTVYETYSPYIYYIEDGTVYEGQPSNTLGVSPCVNIV